MYAGVHRSGGYDWRDEEQAYYYRLEELNSCAEFNGRLVVNFARAGRQSYLNADRWVDELLIEEILPQRMSIGDFPGFKAVDLSKGELDIVVSRGLASWRADLSNVAGVYLISHPVAGKLYVGSAYGEGGIWQRWCQYSATGHGGNVGLKALLENEVSEHPGALRFSILEIADVHASKEEIIARESHWKRILLTRTHGLNAN